MAEERLSLFPLKVVLFPGSALPLHIFEERYKTLINECIREEGTEFGINLKNDDQLKRVGCSAVVREMMQRYEDGRMDIIVEGRRRYELHSLDEKSAPYAVGRVTFFTNEPYDVDIALADRTARLYNSLIQIVYEEKLPKLLLDALARNVSYVIAQKSGLTLAQRQDLLEMQSENQRLMKLFDYLMTVLPKLHQLQEVQRIVGNDGYV
ncbi:MAG: LON peptidase substrate-binding domain-containing protein [Bacteroidota bacterium]